MTDHPAAIAPAIVDALNKRLNIYRVKYAREMDREMTVGMYFTYTKSDAIQYVIEAIELLALEAGLGIADQDGHITQSGGRGG